MKTRYTVFDHKRNMKFTYTEWQQKLTFTLVFVFGIGVGILLCYWF